MSPDRPNFYRLMLAIAGILGAIGIAAAAGASHAADAPLLGALALIALSQAPAVLALALFANNRRMLMASTALIAFGAVLFAADLAARHFLGSPLFPMSAPLGGLAMIAGWLLLVAAAVVGRAT
jgi:uncharacterized membrane protein YgdD (TMEM256/DUF423 family)